MGTRKCLARQLTEDSDSCTQLELGCFINEERDPIEDLYLTVSTLPGMDGVGTLISVDKDKRVDLCYRVKPDGSIIGWVSLDREDEHPLPLTLRFNDRGKVDRLNIEFSSGFVAEYTLSSFDDYFYPSEEVGAEEPFMTEVDF